MRNKFFTNVQYHPSFIMSFEVYFAQHTTGYKQILQDTISKLFKCLRIYSHWTRTRHFEIIIVSKVSTANSAGQLMYLSYDSTSKKLLWRYQGTLKSELTTSLSTERWYKENYIPIKANFLNFWFMWYHEFGFNLSIEFCFNNLESFNWYKINSKQNASLLLCWMENKSLNLLFTPVIILIQVSGFTVLQTIVQSLAILNFSSLHQFLKQHSRQVECSARLSMGQTQPFQMSC